MVRNKTKIITKYAHTHKGIIIVYQLHQFLNCWGCVMQSIGHFELCKDDGTETPWKRAENRLFTYYKTIEEAKEGIDKYLNGSIILYTDAQRNKYVSNYNRKHGWGFNKQMLLNTMRMHKKGNEIMKSLMEDRLEDANFHGYCGALAERDYDKFMDILKEEYDK